MDTINYFEEEKKMQEINVQKFDLSVISLGQLVTNEAIAKMHKEYMPLVINDLADKIAFAAVHSARMDVKGKRIEVIKKGKELRDDAIKFQKVVIEEEKRIVGLLAPIEAHLDKEEGKVEAEKERIKAEAEAKEAARIQERFDLLESLGMSMSGGNYSLPWRPEGLSLPQVIVKASTDEQFAQFVTRIKIENEAEGKRQADAARLQYEEQAKLAKIAAEQKVEAERLAALEAERLEKERALREKEEALEKEKQRIADEEAARVAKAKREVEALATEEKRLNDLEEAKKKAAEEAIIAEQERAKREAKESAEKAEKERIANERKEARRPDKEKLLVFSEFLTNIEYPTMKTPEGESIILQCHQEFLCAIKALRERASAL